MVARGELQWRPLDMSAMANPTSCPLHHKEEICIPFSSGLREQEVVWGGTNICIFFFQDSKFGCGFLRVACVWVYV